MNNILYVVSNINLETVNLVATCLSKRYQLGFQRIVFFESPEAEKIEYEQTKIYRKFFNSFEKTVVLLNEDGSIPPEQLYSVFGFEGNKVVDLSNGPKVTTSSLYLASTLCNLQDIYCLIFHTKPAPKIVEGRDYEYLKLKKLQGAEKLAKLSYFDLIYYSEDVKSIIAEPDRARSKILKEIFNGMITGIYEFFSAELDTRSVVNNLTFGNETLVSKMLDYLKGNATALEFARKNHIDLDFNGDPIGVLSRFFKNYAKNGEDMNLVCLSTTPGLFSGLRDYRNISSHYATNHAVLTDDCARTVINMQIEVLKCLRKNSELWRVI